MLQRVCNEVGLPEPTLVISSTDRQVKQLLSIVYRVGNDLRDASWPRLQKEHTITLVAGQEAYPFPSDYDFDISETHWNKSSTNSLIGPLSPSEWQSLKNDHITSNITNYHFRIKGAGTNQFFIDPVPTATDAGQILVFEYQSLNWIRPRTWTASTVFDPGSYCSFNGVFFRTSAGGNSGATPPTPTALNDGGVTWVVVTSPYTAFAADSDEFEIDEDLVGLGVQWNYLASKGLPYAHLENKYRGDLQVSRAKSQGGETLSLAPGWSLYGSGYRNYRITP
jgi:hypothetical protein